MYSNTILISFITISAKTFCCCYLETLSNNDGNNSRIFQMKLLSTCIDGYMDYNIFV